MSLSLKLETCQLLWEKQPRKCRGELDTHGLVRAAQQLGVVEDACKAQYLRG